MNIEVGKKLFEFKSKQDWINLAQRIWKQQGRSTTHFYEYPVIFA